MKYKKFSIIATTEGSFLDALLSVAVGNGYKRGINSSSGYPNTFVIFDPNTKTIDCLANLPDQDKDIMNISLDTGQLIDYLYRVLDLIRHPEKEKPILERFVSNLYLSDGEVVLSACRPEDCQSTWDKTKKAMAEMGFN